MVVKKSAKKGSKTRRRAVQVVRGGLTRLKRRAAAPTPAQKPLPSGVLRADAEKTQVPSEWLDSQQSPAENPTPVILVIGLLAGLWIALLAWFVSQMEDR